MSYSKFTIETTESHNFRQYDNTTYLSSSSCKFTYESGVWTACTLHFSSQNKTNDDDNYHRRRGGVRDADCGSYGQETFRELRRRYIH